MKFSKLQAVVASALIASLAASPAFAQVDTSELTTQLTALGVTVGVIFTAIFGYNVLRMVGRKTAKLGNGN